MRREPMTRAEAADLLGVPADAPPATVRHAWRMWARIAHPDVGGDPAHFARLERARRILMRPPPAPVQPPPRATWSQVLRRPARPRRLAVAAVIAVGLALLPAAARLAPEVTSPTLPLVIAALPAAVAAALWAVIATASILGPGADRGHRMLALAVAWAPIALAQQVLALLAGTSLLTVLPVLALPLAVAVSLVNPGAGLWRPATTSP